MKLAILISLILIAPQVCFAWNPLHREGTFTKNQDRRREAGQDLDRYRNSFNQQLADLNAQRSEALELTNLASRIKAVAAAVHTDCVTKPLAIVESGLCVERLESVVNDLKSLKTRAEALSSEKDQDIAAKSGQLVREAQASYSRLSAILMQWRNIKSLYAKRKANCEAAPLAIKNTLVAIDKNINRSSGSVDPSVFVVEALQKLTAVKNLDLEIHNKCDRPLEDFSDSIRKADIAVNKAMETRDFRKWFNERCQKGHELYPDDIPCEMKPTPAFLFTLRRLKLNELR